MKKILIPLVSFKISETSITPFNGARETYIKKMLKYNLLPIFASHLMNPEMRDALYTMCDGVLLMGGYDVNPELYGAKRHPETKTSECMDDLESYFIRKAISDKKPLLGICRGSQIINVVAGGTLHQHLGDNTDITENHGASEGHSYDHLIESWHDVEIRQDTRLHTILEKDQVRVNTGHHQAIDTIAPGFQMSARSPEGVIEAIERTDNDHFCVGVQSHPEAVEESFFEPLFASFANAVEEYGS